MTLKEALDLAMNVIEQVDPDDTLLSVDELEEVSNVLGAHRRHLFGNPLEG